MGLAALALLARRPWSGPVALTLTAHGVRVLSRSLPDVAERPRLAVALAIRGLGWALRQESALVLRHWWPPAFAGALVSNSARRIVVSAMIVDLVATRIEKPDLDVGTTFAGRRIDDLAYGTGLWWGAFRVKRLRCLRIRLLR